MCLIDASLLFLDFFEYPLELFISLAVLFELLDLFCHPFGKPEGLIHKLRIPWVEVVRIEKVVFLQWAQGVFDAHPTIFIQVVVHLRVFTPGFVVTRKLIDPILSLFFSAPLLILKPDPFIMHHLFHVLLILELNVCELYKVLLPTGALSSSHRIHTLGCLQDAQATAVVGVHLLQRRFRHLIRVHGRCLKELLSCGFVLAEELLFNLMLVGKLRLRLGIFRVIFLTRLGGFRIISLIYKSTELTLLAGLQ